MNRTVLALVEDLFWRTKIEHAVKSAQRKVIFLSDPDEVAAAADPDGIGLLLVDLALRKDPFPMIAKLKKTPGKREIPVVGYFEHVRRDVKDKATEAGCDEVLPRSQFSEHLGDLILKYILPGSVKTQDEEVELPEE